jgi:hypothetical protein
LVFMGLALLAVLAILSTSPPPPKPESAAPTEFSAARAEKVLADLVGDGMPHPPGTQAHERVRDAVAAHLTALGLEVERMTSFVCGARTCASVTNLLARMPGRVGANAVVLTAHYDSVPAGPGASDDGMGVATLLETARALRASPSPRRPVWLLVTDGEELGLLGAKAFARTKLLLDQVGVVVNIDDRGTTGPSLMFETSKNDAGLVRVFARSTEHPVASSIFPTIYGLLPNDTDLSVYKRAGIAGLNYAVIGGVARYHTPRDDLAHADLRSLQHHGDNALAVVRALAEGRDSVAASTDLVFFDVLGAFVIRWADPVGPWIALGLIAAYALVTVLALRRGILTASEHAIGLFGVLTVPAAGAVAFGSCAGLHALGAAPSVGGTLAPLWIAHPAWTIAASCGLGGLAASAVALRVARSAGLLGLAWGTTTWLTAGGAVLAVALPGLSFLFLVPAALGSLGALVSVARGTPSSRAHDALLAALMPLGAVLVWVPPLGMLYDALGWSLVPALGAGTGLLVWTAGASLAELSPRMRSLLLSGVATGSLVAAAAALTVAPFTVDVPSHVSFRTYVADGGEVRTTLSARETVSNALQALFPLVESPWPWSSEQSPAAKAAPRDAEPEPSLEVLSDTSQGTTRRILAKIASSRGASVVGLALPVSAHPTTIHVQGVPLEPGPDSHSDWRWFECVTTPPEGVEIELTVDAAARLEGFVYDRTPGVANGEPRKLLEARPLTAAPIQNGDLTIVARHVDL